MLEVGPNFWPFPVPLMKVAGGWRFDTAAGVEEILNRRIGRNELESCASCAPTSRPSASTPAGIETATKSWSSRRNLQSPGQTDGLFWAPEVNGKISPLGP